MVVPSAGGLVLPLGHEAEREKSCTDTFTLFFCRGFHWSYICSRVG